MSEVYSGLLENVLILGGSGQMGTLLSRSLHRSGIRTMLVDSRPPVPDPEVQLPFLQSDVGELDENLTAAIRAADGVFVCLPEKITLRIALQTISAMKQGSLWVDTLSVKGDVLAAIEGQAGRVEVLSVNPMFAPVMGWPGGAVAVIALGSGPKAALLKELLESWGARLEFVSADEHDRLTAAIQVATHAAVLCFGLTLLQMKFDLPKGMSLATPPHKLLLTLLHRMTTQSAEVYWDIQAYHPMGVSVRQQLIDAMEQLHRMVNRQELSQFAEVFARLSNLLEPSADVLRDMATRVFPLLRQ